MAGAKGRSGGQNKRSVTDHEQRGTYRPSRHKPRAVVQVPAPLNVDPPEHLVDEARGFWQELAPLLRPRLTALDLPRLELLCVHLGHHRRLYVALNRVLATQKAGGPVSDTSALTRAMRQEADTIRSLSIGFGLDPLDRERLPVTPHRKNPWSAVAAAPSRWAGILP